MSAQVLSRPRWASHELAFGRSADARLVIVPSAISDAIGSAVGQASYRDAGRFLTTVLITDIVDCTGTAMRLGDRWWREVRRP